MMALIGSPNRNMAASLDTLEISKRLRQAGFSEPQAEVVTAVLRETREFDLAQLATKADLTVLRADMALLATRADLALLRADMEKEIGLLRSEIGTLRREFEARTDSLKSDLLARIEAAKSDTIKWVVGIGFAQVAMIVALLRFFPGAHP